MSSRDDKHGEPIFLKVGASHELCRFPTNGAWSLRIKQDGDEAHVRYLNEFEAEIVNAALDYALRSHEAAPDPLTIEGLIYSHRKSEAAASSIAPSAVEQVCRSRCDQCREGYPYTARSKAEGSFLFHAVGEHQLPCDARDIRLLAVSARVPSLPMPAGVMRTGTSSVQLVFVDRAEQFAAMTAIEDWMREDAKSSAASDGTAKP